jgi:hypothetical protein
MVHVLSSDAIDAKRWSCPPVLADVEDVKADA